MANSAPTDPPEYAAPLPLEMAMKGSNPTPIPRPDESPAPSRSTSLGPDSIGMENDIDTPVTTAGRKRKLNSTSVRGVAHLTPDQLAKKRANDRQAQRAIRERTKTHIEALEQQVRDLSSQKPVLDLQAALQHHERIRAENQELRQGLKAAMDIIQPLLARPEIPDLPPFLSQTKPVRPTSHESPIPDSDHLTSHPHSMATEKAYAESIGSLDTPSPTQSAPTLGTRRNSSNGGHSSSSVRLALCQSVAHGLDFGMEERLGFNFLFRWSTKCTQSRSCPAQQLRKLSHLSSLTNLPFIFAAIELFIRANTSRIRYTYQKYPADLPAGQYFARLSSQQTTRSCTRNPPTKTSWASIPKCFFTSEPRKECQLPSRVKGAHRHPPHIPRYIITSRTSCHVIHHVPPNALANIPHTGKLRANARLDYTTSYSTDPTTPGMDGLCPLATYA